MEDDEEVGDLGGGAGEAREQVRLAGVVIEREQICEDLRVKEREGVSRPFAERYCRRCGSGC